MTYETIKSENQTAEAESSSNPNPNPSPATDTIHPQVVHLFEPGKKRFPKSQREKLTHMIVLFLGKFSREIQYNPEVR